MSDEDTLRANEGVRAVSSRPEVTTTRYAFISRLGSVAYVGVTYDGTGVIGVHVTETRAKPRASLGRRSG